MRFGAVRMLAALLAVLSLAAVATDAPTYAQGGALPNPVLFLMGQEPFQTAGKDFIRYRYGVENSSAYPDSMFAPAPQLPPCEKNTKSSRTWVDLYSQDGKRLNGFCAFTKASDLNSIWFALASDAVPPSWVYVELNDRSTNTKYKSNLAETSQ